MDNVLLFKEAKRLQHLNRKPPNQTQWNASKVIGLYEFVKVNAKQLK